MQKKVYDLTEGAPHSKHVARYWPEALFAVEDPAKIEPLLGEMRKRNLKTWLDVMKWVEEAKPSEDKSFLKPFVENSSPTLGQPWFVLAILRYFFFAGEFERKYFRENIQRLFAADAPDIIVHNDDDRLTGKTEEYMRKIVTNQVIVCSHPFLARDPTPEERMFSTWFEHERSLGPHDLSFGFQGMRIKIDFIHYEIRVGRILYTPLTKEISAKDNLNEVEVMFDSVMEEGMKTGAKSPEELTSKKDPSVIAAEYRLRKSAMTYSREKLIEVFSTIYLMKLSPPAFEVEDLDGNDKPITTKRISDHILEIENGWQEVVKIFGDKAPDALVRSYEKARKDAIERLNKLSGVN